MSKEPITIVNGIEYKGLPEDIIRKLLKQVQDLKERGQSYYCIIPWKLLTDKRISSTTKLLYGEVSALVGKDGYCWASNEHFANILGIKTATRISKLISELRDLNYIYVEIDRDGGNKRRIYILPPIIRISSVTRFLYSLI